MDKDEIVLVMPTQIEQPAGGRALLIDAQTMMVHMDSLKFCDANGFIIGEITSVSHTKDNKIHIKARITDKKVAKKLLNLPTKGFSIRQYEQCPGCGKMSVDFDESEPMCDLCGWAE